MPVGSGSDEEEDASAKNTPAEGDSAENDVKNEKTNRILDMKIKRHRKVLF